MASNDIILTFTPDGKMKVQGVEGKKAETELKWLLNGMGDVEVRGHKHTQESEEGVKIKTE